MPSVEPLELSCIFFIYIMIVKIENDKKKISVKRIAEIHSYNSCVTHIIIWSRSAAAVLTGKLLSLEKFPLLPKGVARH